MSDNHTRRLPTRRAERQLVKVAAEALKTGYSNPERIGCPQADAIAAVVWRKRSFQDFNDIVDHIATCAPCFVEYNRRRQHHRIRTAGPWILGCAAVLILALLWMYGPLGPVHPEPTVAKTVPALKTATLDYRNWTVERSGVSRPPAAERPRLARERLELLINLPIGTEDGLYTVQFRSESDKPVAEATGNAIWNGAAEVLSVRIDLGKVPPGDYTLHIRSAGGAPRTYPVILE